MSCALVSTTPPKSMREMLGLADPTPSNNIDDDEKHQEKTA